MLLSMNWIGDFVDLSGVDRRALIERFTLSTAEVEDIYVMGEGTHGVIAAQVASMTDHPNSRKLHLLKIDTGSGLLDCVCGAPNVRPGMHVAFVRAGGAVCGHPITEATVAGYPSFGMCCSEAELGISDDNSGLMELPEDIPLGTDLKEVFDIDDIVFEVDNKSLTNRPDLWGHYGIAREFATLLGRPLRPVPQEDGSRYSSLPPLDIEVNDTEHCYRYVGARVENITVAKSPVNMRIRLYYCGSRAINFLADLTNYVMLELGQPMHAFDLRRVDAVEVRRFPEPFDFTTLDGVSRRIEPSMLMICSHGVPVAVAGVMGGDASKIEEDTHSLLLESATFDGVCIRRTGAALGLRTDASMRYEKMLDPELTMQATLRALCLIREIDPGARVTASITDRYVYHYPVITLEIDKNYVDRYTGIDISCDRIETTLRALGFGVVREGDRFTVTVPSFRATKDVTIRADLIEEITRIYGYDNFEIRTTTSPLRPVRFEETRIADDETKDLLVRDFKLHEVHSYIWFDAAKNRELGIETPDNVRLLCPQSPDLAVLRNSMIPTLLGVAADNRGFADRFGVFEIGRVVRGLRENGDCDEHKCLGIVLFSRREGEEALFLSLRDILVTMFRLQKHCAVTFTRTEAVAWEHPANTFAVSVGDRVLGRLTVPHPTVGQRIDRRAALAMAEIDMEAFAALPKTDLQYSEPSRFPGIDIDLSFRCDAPEQIDFDALRRACLSVGGEWLADVRATDLYEGEGETSLCLRLTFLSHERTLSKSEVQAPVDAVIRALEPFGLHFKAV